MTQTKSIPDIDWPGFLKKQDMHFTKLPGRWEEAPHFGNAMIGSMLYQADNALRLQVFRADVRDHRDESYGWTAYSRPRFLIGHFELKTEGILRQAAELHPNGLWPCSNNPCIESTLSLMNNIQEMLIQSWTDTALTLPGPIRIFPALPSSWRNVLFCDLRAEGAFLVSAERRNGSTIWVRVKSLAGEPCRIRPGFDGLASVSAVEPNRVKSIDNGIYTVELKAGEEIRLTAC